jgi:prevent-host-death family protein
MVVMNVSRLRAGLSAAIDRVARGEEVMLTRHGEPIARIVPVVPRTARDAARQENAERAAELLESIERLRGKPLDIGRGISTERAEQLVRELRAERDES